MSTGDSNYLLGRSDSLNLVARNKRNSVPDIEGATTTRSSDEPIIHSEPQSSGAILPTHTNTKSAMGLSLTLNEDSPRARLLAPGTVRPKQKLSLIHI